MDEHPKNPFSFPDPLPSGSFSVSNARYPPFPYQNDLDLHTSFKPTNDLYESSFLPDYLNNEDQISYCNANFDELPFKEEKRSYINSFLPQEVIGVYNNQHTDNEDEFGKGFHLMSEEELDKNDGFSNPQINFEMDDEKYQMQKEDDFEVSFF